MSRYYSDADDGARVEMFDAYRDSLPEDRRIELNTWLMAILAEMNERNPRCRLGIGGAKALVVAMAEHWPVNRR